MVPQKIYSRNIYNIMNFGQTVKSESISIIFTALILFAVFAWKDVIGRIIDQYYPLKQDSFKAKLLFAALVTVAVIVMVTYVKPRLSAL